MTTRRDRSEDEGRRDPPPFGVPPSEEGRSGNLGPPPPVFRPQGRGAADEPPPPYQIPRVPPPRRRWWPRLLVVFVALLVLVLVANLAIGLYVDRLWFNALGYGGVFTTRLTTQVWLFGAGFGVALAYLGGMGALAWRLPLLSTRPAASPFPELSLAAVRRGAMVVSALAGLFLAILLGAIASGHWEAVQLFLHAQPFGVTDPQFGRDVGFYVFKLEPLQFIKGWAVGLALLGLLGSAGVYGLRVVLHGGVASATPPVRVHLAGQMVAVLGLFAWGYWLARFELALSDGGVVFGAAYTDVHLRAPAFLVLMAAAALAAVAVLSWVAHRRVLVPAAALGALAAASLLGQLILPAAIQSFTVEPNELERESPYIARNIIATRAAFGLNAIAETEFAAQDAVTPADIATDPDALRNVRVWDHRPLRDTLNTIQSIRPLYAFSDVDVDRYQVDGKERQVFLAARELSQASLQPNQRGWVNRRLQFTHGFGVTVSPVDEVTPEGEPVFFVSNIPPEIGPLVDGSALTVTQPRIYHGEDTQEWVIVNTTSEEFDYPLAGSAAAEEGAAVESQATNQYDGAGGLRLGGALRRLALAWVFGDRNIVISSSLSADSRILFRRSVPERVHELAPFLLLDDDPYLVIRADGRLAWIQDAYTTTNRYPYAQPHGTGVNYMRNAVKAVVDAYDGTVDFYIVDESDPIVRAWAEIFPNLFQPGSAFPDDLRAHWRYPEDLFQVQADQYLTYHITSPRTLFNREDVWAVPREVLRDQSVPLEPYYITLQLPDSTAPEFLLILPFTPLNRPNAIAWLAGRSDGSHYGGLFAFRFPRNKNVIGPEQVEARIGQDPEISSLFTLLGQQGSQIIRGNLLFIPLGQSYVYVEPLYVQAETSRYPQLKFVVVVNGDTVAIAESLGEAVREALGASAPAQAVTGDETPPASPPGAPAAESPPATGEQTAPAPSALPPNLADLIAQADHAFRAAQDAFAAGDFAEYGRQLDRLQDILLMLTTASAGAATTP